MGKLYAQCAGAIVMNDDPKFKPPYTIGKYYDCRLCNSTLYIKESDVEKKAIGHIVCKDDVTFPREGAVKIRWSDGVYVSFNLVEIAENGMETKKAKATKAPKPADYVMKDVGFTVPAVLLDMIRAGIRDLRNKIKAAADADDIERIISSAGEMNNLIYLIDRIDATDGEIELRQRIYNDI